MLAKLYRIQEPSAGNTQFGLRGPLTARIVCENQTLKNSVVALQKQVEMLKRTLKYTQIKELEVENKVLTDELLRMKKMLASKIIQDNKKNQKQNESSVEWEKDKQSLVDKIDELETQLLQTQVHANLHDPNGEFLQLQESVKYHQQQFVELKDLIETLKDAVKEKDKIIQRLTQSALDHPIKDVSRVSTMIVDSFGSNRFNRLEFEEEKEKPLQMDEEDSSKGKDEETNSSHVEDSFYETDLVKLKDLTHLSSVVEFMFQIYEK